MSDENGKQPPDQKQEDELQDEKQREKEHTREPEPSPNLSSDLNTDNESPPSTNLPPPAPSHAAQVWKGIGLLALLHLLLMVIPVAYFGIGIAQLIYLIPAIILCRKNVGVVQGLAIGAGITFLLNAACFGIVLGGWNF